MNTLIENKKPHTSVSSEGKSTEQYSQWLEVSQPITVSPSIDHGFIVRPEFRSGYDSFFGSHGFIVESDKGNLLITELHAMDELIKKVSIDTTAANKNNTGKELPRYINSVNLYNVLEDKWMFYEMGTAGPMMVLPDARTDDEEPYSYRDIATFLIKENNEVKTGHLALVTPDIGEPVSLAAKVPGNRNIHHAVVVEKTECTFFDTLIHHWNSS